MAFSSLPWDQVLAALLAPRGLAYADAGDKLLIGPGKADALAGRGRSRADLPDPAGLRGAAAVDRLAARRDGVLRRPPAAPGLRAGRLRPPARGYFAVAYPPNGGRPRIVSDYGWLGGSTTVDQEGVKVENDDGTTTFVKRPVFN